MTDYMQLAIKMAKKASRRGEVPIGAVIVCNGKVIAKAHNMRERSQNALAHAEVLVIGKACRKLGSWRLDNCDMYVTLEPCAMCMGAATNARIRNVYFGAKTTTDLNHTLATCYIPNDECSRMLKDFFREARTTDQSR